MRTMWFLARSVLLTSKGIPLEIPLDFTRKVSLKKLPETCTINTCVHAKLLQLCPTLCNPMDCSPPSSSVCEILQARILEWVAIPFSRGSSQPRDWTWVSFIAGRFFTIWATFKWLYVNHIFFIHSSVDGHLGCFQILAILSGAAVSIGVHVSFQITVFVFSGYMPRSRVAGLCAA